MGSILVAWQGAGTLLAIVALGDYLHVAVFTWIQRQVPPATLGRAMSIFMFNFMGISPVSSALTGWLMHRLSHTRLFAGSDDRYSTNKAKKKAAISFHLRHSHKIHEQTISKLR